jgi:hypothetical protein
MATVAEALDLDALLVALSRGPPSQPVAAAALCRDAHPSTAASPGDP